MGGSVRRDGATLKGPDEALLPFLAHGFVLNFCQCPGDTRIGAVDVVVDDVPLPIFQTVFFVPDIQRSALEFDGAAIAADGTALLGC